MDIQIRQSIIIDYIYIIIELEALTCFHKLILEETMTHDPVEIMPMVQVSVPEATRIEGITPIVKDNPTESTNDLDRFITGHDVVMSDANVNVSNDTPEDPNEGEHIMIATDLGLVTTVKMEPETKYYVYINRGDYHYQPVPSTSNVVAGQVGNGTTRVIVSDRVDPDQFRLTHPILRRSIEDSGERPDLRDALPPLTERIMTYDASSDLDNYTPGLGRTLRRATAEERRSIAAVGTEVSSIIKDITKTTDHGNNLLPCRFKAPMHHPRKIKWT